MRTLRGQGEHDGECSTDVHARILSFSGVKVTVAAGGGPGGGDYRNNAMRCGRTPCGVEEKVVKGGIGMWGVNSRIERVWEGRIGEARCSVEGQV